MYPPSPGNPAYPGEPQGAYAPPGPPPKGRSKLPIVLAVVGVLAVAAIIGVAIYFFAATGTKVKSAAYKHLPKGCDVALRLDTAQLMKVKPVKKHVVAALEEVLKDKGGGRLAAFLIAARLDPKKDIHDVAVCLNGVKMTGEPDYGIVVGGSLLDEDGVVTALDKHDTADELKAPKKVGGLFVLEDKDGTLISQSQADAALLLASDKEILGSIAKKGTSFEDYDIPLKEQIVAVISPDTITSVLGGLGPFAPPTAELKKVGRIVLTMTLDPGEVGVNMQFPSTESAQQAKGELTAVFGMMALSPFGPGAKPAVKHALKGAKVKTKGKELIVTMPLDEDAIEETCEEIGDDIREQNEKE